MYHDCSEVITGDLPSPIKYHTREITKAYKAIERQAEQELLNLLPEDLREDYRPVIIEENIPDDQRLIIKAADTIAAYIKCRTEVAAGNREFSKAEEAVKIALIILISLRCCILLTPLWAATRLLWMSY